MSTNADQPSPLALVGIGQVIVILLQSFALLAYKRALTPLYSSVPASSYISYVTIASSVLGSVVGVPTSVAALAYGSLLAAAPNTVYYVGKYTARWRDPILGPIVTHVMCVGPDIGIRSCVVAKCACACPFNPHPRPIAENFVVVPSSARIQKPYLLDFSASPSCCLYSRHSSLSGMLCSNYKPFLLRRL
jgi:hypothetical protein